MIAVIGQMGGIASSKKIIIHTALISRSVQRSVIRFHGRVYYITHHIIDAYIYLQSYYKGQLKTVSIAKPLENRRHAQNP